MKRSPPRDRDTVSTIKITVIETNGTAARLCAMLKSRSLINHLNRTLLTFEFPDGRKETFTVWPHDGDHKAYSRAVDNLNWSEH